MNDLAKNKRKNIYKKKLILKNKNGFKVHKLFLYIVSKFFNLF